MWNSVRTAGLLAVLAAFLVLAAGCGGGGGGGGGSTGGLSVTGTVLDVATNQPTTSAATVTIGGQNTATNATGVFTLSGVSSTATTATITAAGEQTLSLGLKLPATSSAPVNLGTIYLSTTGYTAAVTGQVVTTVNGQNQAVAGATVTIAGSSTTSATDGTFTVSGLAVGLGNDPTLPIGSISATGYVTKSIFVQLPLIAGTNNLGPLSLGLPISGNVPSLPYTVTGQVLKGTTIQPGLAVAISSGTTVLGNFTTDAGGNFYFWVVPGTYQLSVGLSNGQIVSQNVTLLATNKPVTQNVNIP